jgi:bifunctional aromatase (cyclase/dehydratase)
MPSFITKDRGEQMSELSTVDRGTQRATRAELEQFYAEQMMLLDEGDAASWAETFTEDGIFVPPNAPAVQGRAAMRAGAERTAAEFRGKGMVRRHVVANLNLVSLEGGKAQVTAYVLVVDSAQGASRITTSTIVHDELHSDGARWYLAHRVVRRDIDGPA